MPARCRCQIEIDFRQCHTDFACEEMLLVALASPPATNFEVDIGDAECDFYERNGFLVIDKVSTPTEIDWLRDVYDELISRPASGFLDGVFDLTAPYGTRATPSVGQLLFPERWVPAIRATAMWNNARRIATRLLGAGAQVESWGHIIFKSPNTGRETPWHQDEAYWDAALSYHAVGSWMPLQDVDVDNGCLWFLPGTHRGRIHPHRHLGNDPAVHILEVVEPVDTTDAVPVPLAAGGMTFHHPRLLHYAGRNAKGGVRRAWANEFQTAPVKRRVPAHRPWVLDGLRAMSERQAQSRS
jgi:Phytanoyl-CoA dioxygenase (PhyH)